MPREKSNHKGHQANYFVSFVFLDYPSSCATIPVVKKNLARLLKQKLPALRKLFASDPRVLAVFLFGSQADGTATARSDIDLAVLFGRDLDFKAELDFQVALCDVLEIYEKVDVVNLNRVPLRLRYRAISGKLLYARDEVPVADFVERTLIEYPDCKYRLDRFNAEFLKSLKDEYAHLRHRPHHRTHKNHRKQFAPA